MDNPQKQHNTKNLNVLVRQNETSAEFDALYSATYVELQHIARELMTGERQSHTLQPTALVNESYLRLFDLDNVQLHGRSHFVNLASQVMRRVLVDHARAKSAQKRGGDWHAVTLAGVGVNDLQNQLDVLELDDALDKLAKVDTRSAKVVEMRVFGGLTMDEISQQLDLTRRTIQKDWRFATLWLRRTLSC